MNAASASDDDDDDRPSALVADALPAETPLADTSPADAAAAATLRADPPGAAPPRATPARPAQPRSASAGRSGSAGTTGLNDAQTHAVRAPAGPLLVLAGAGTGKTRVVIARIAELVRRGTRPERILAVTFTNKAAKEMLSRAGGLIRRGGKQKPEISTIHSLCVRILRRHAARVGLPTRFAIVDRGEQESVARKVLKELRVPEATLRPGDLLDRVSRWKSAGVRPDGAFAALPADAGDSWELAAAGYRRYQQHLRTAGAVDFDDLLLVVDELFTGHEPVRRAEAGRFDHVLVDEYQDTSGIQERIVAALARDHRSLCVVGDDDQSIYGWRGAEVSHIIDFARRWPGATIVRLEENYRSTPEIIHAANTLIARNARRHGKTLVSRAPSGPPPAIIQAQDDVDESRRVVGDLEGRLREGSVAPSEAVILVRTGEQTRVFEQELRRRQIPYELIGSHSFFDRREVKDVMALLRVLVNPADDLALARIANVPPRGLSSATMQAARAAAAAAGTSVWGELQAARDAHRLSTAATAGVMALERVLALREAAGDRGAAATLQAVLDMIGYRGHLDREYADDPGEADTRWACVEQMHASLAEHERTHGRGAVPADRFVAVVTGFLDDLVLDVTEAERFRSDKPRGNVLRLMTLHAAKGLEFDNVWMVGLEEGLLPHHRSLGDGLIGAIDEERRLCYVGVTRARKRLALSLCLTRMKWGKSRPCRPSRFLYELTGQADKFVEHVTDGAADPASKGSPRGASASAARGRGRAPRRGPRAPG
jgi:DNA helicase-2/ATP-dependent DNA helicase PcrA